MNVFITGNSSGLGYALTRLYLSRGDVVSGLSRRGCQDLEGMLYDMRCDLFDVDAIPTALETLYADAPLPDLVYLNAGLLGPVAELSQTSMEEVNRIMAVNVWSNKVILDWFLGRKHQPAQVVLVSSGASVSGSAGWNAYSLSKATLNMLAQLYAHEFPHSHFTALAPGLVDTAMQAAISDPRVVDTTRFPSFQRLRDARARGDMPDPEEAARKMDAALDRLTTFPSGSFVDVRDLDD